MLQRRHVSPARLGEPLVTEYYECDSCDARYKYSPAQDRWQPYRKRIDPLLYFFHQVTRSSVPGAHLSARGLGNRFRVQRDLPCVVRPRVTLRPIGLEVDHHEAVGRIEGDVDDAFDQVPRRGRW